MQKCAGDDPRFFIDCHARLDRASLLFEFFAPLGHNFCSLALNDDIRIGVVVGGFEIETSDFCTVRVRKAFESCGRIHDAACADVDKFIAAL